MGTWDIGFFDNDMACDWENGIKENKNLKYIKSAIIPVLNNTEETLDIDAANKLLAASEALARLSGSPGISNSFTENLDEWVDEFKDTIPLELKSDALLALEKVTDIESELRQLWALRGELDTWKKSIEDLKVRLQNSEK